MRTAAIDSSTTMRRWRVLVGALLLALTPGLAGATETEEWPTTPDRGRGSPKKIPWMRFSGDLNAQVVTLVPGRAVQAQEVVVVREHEPSRRERRLLRRAKRLAEKAARLRAKVGSRGTYAVVVPAVSVVPVVQTVQVAPPAPPRPVVVQRGRPEVQVVHLERAHEDESCDDDDDDHDDDDERHVPVVIDADRLSADVERQVERALRDAERAQERAERARERARRDAERGRRGR